MIYVGGGFVSEGSSGYEDGDEVVEDYDVYDWEFDTPIPTGIAPGRPAPVKGEKITRRLDATREHPQFAKRYNVEIDLDKLREALEWMVTRSDTPGAVRSDEIYDRQGEVAGKAFWVGFGPDAKAGAVHDALLEAFRSAGVDIAGTLIGAANLRRGLERSGGILKQSFFRVFIPSPGWKLLQDWTILREGEKKTDVRPELQEMVRDRQRARRLEIIETLKDIRVAEVHAAELAGERNKREAAEARVVELAGELQRQDRVIAAVALPHAPSGWDEAVKRARARAEAPVPHATPSGWDEAVKLARAKAAQQAAERNRQHPAQPLVKPQTRKPRPTVAERARKTEIQRVQRRARYLENKAGTGRSLVARKARTEAKELRREAEQLKSKSRRKK